MKNTVKENNSSLDEAKDQISELQDQIKKHPSRPTTTTKEFKKRGMSKRPLGQY